MSKELLVAHCPRCGKVFQKNLRNLCMSCSTEEDQQIRTIENQLKRNRHLSNNQITELTTIPAQRIRALIRNGKIRLFDYPNLTDACDLCSAAIRQGKLCVACSMRIQVDIKHELEQSRRSTERTFFTKHDR